MEVDMFDTVSARLDEITPGLMNDLLDKSIIKEEKWVHSRQSLAPYHSESSQLMFGTFLCTFNQVSENFKAIWWTGLWEEQIQWCADITLQILHHHQESFSSPGPGWFDVPHSYSHSYLTSFMSFQKAFVCMAQYYLASRPGVICSNLHELPNPTIILIFIILIIIFIICHVES